MRREASIAILPTTLMSQDSTGGDDRLVTLRRLFEWFDSEAVPYAVMRNWEGLPETFVGNDLDLLVRKRDRSHVTRNVKRIAASDGWRLIQELSRPYIYALKFAKATSEVKFPSILHVDLFTQANWRVFSYMPAQVGLNARVLGEGKVWRLDASMECFLSLSHHLLWTGLLHKQRYIDKVAHFDVPDRGELRRLLSQTFGSRLAKEIVQWALDGGTLDRDLRREARIAVVRRGMSHPRNVFRLLGETVADELRTLGDPRGLLFRCPLGSAARSELDSLAEWLGSIWKYNHIATSGLQGALVTSSKTDADAVEQVAYRDASTVRARRARTLRLRRRGWIIGFGPAAESRMGIKCSDLDYVPAEGASAETIAGGITDVLVGRNAL